MTVAAHPDAPKLTRTATLVFAVTAGSSAACLYYLQPLLDGIAADLHVSTPAASLLVSAAQVGYLVGLALVVPLGDFVERRHLVPGLLATSVIALLLSAVAPTYLLLLFGVFVTGITASAAQVVVPWSSALADPADRGRVVGLVMSGLLLGILLSRVFSGAIAEFGGWRAILLCAAAIQLVMSIGVYLLAPATGRAAPADDRFAAVFVSIATLVRRHALLRQRMVLGFASMACFSGVWTALAFQLAGDGNSPYHYTEFVIGLFGLAGVAGAAGAPRVGKLADRGHLAAATTMVWVSVLLSWPLLAWGGHNVIALIAALIVFDFGVQGVQISNQTAIYALDPAMRSRLTTAYMVMFFAGGVTGSLVGGFAFESGGWALVCWIGFGTSVVATALWALFWARARVRGE